MVKFVLPLAIILMLAGCATTPQPASHNMNEYKARLDAVQVGVLEQNVLNSLGQPTTASTTDFPGGVAQARWAYSMNTLIDNGVFPPGRGMLLTFLALGFGQQAQNDMNAPVIIVWFSNGTVSMVQRNYPSGPTTPKPQITKKTPAHGYLNTHFFEGWDSESERVACPTKSALETCITEAEAGKKEGKALPTAQLATHNGCIILKPGQGTFEGTVAIDKYNTGCKVMYHGHLWCCY